MIFSDQCKPTTFNVECCTQIQFKQVDTAPTNVDLAQIELVNNAWSLYSPVFQNQSHFEFGEVKNYTWNLQENANPFNEPYYIREDEAYVLFYARTSGLLAGWFIDDRVTSQIWEVQVNPDYLTSTFSPSDPQTPFYQYDVVQSFPNTVQICPNDMDYVGDEEFNILVETSTYYKLSIIGFKLKIECVDENSKGTIEVSTVNGVSKRDNDCNYLGIPESTINIIEGAYSDVFSNFTIDFGNVEPIDLDPIFWIIFGCHIFTIIWLIVIGFWHANKF